MKLYTWDAETVGRLVTVVVYPTLGPRIITIPLCLCVHYAAFIYINCSFISLISQIFNELLQPKVPTLGHVNSLITSNQMHSKRIMSDILRSLRG